ncbi:MAG: hypothetical protein RL757_1634 [Bacteroidota bacterium]|jgi:hypothetical protein
MSNVILTTQYFPCLEYFSHFYRTETVEIEQFEHFQKGSYRNRCHIATANGVLALSVPLQRGKHSQLPIREVKISNDAAWQRLQWRTLYSAYGNAPFWEHYAPHIEPFFLKKYDFLWDLNQEIIEKCLKILKIDAEKLQLTQNWLSNAEYTGGGDFRDQISPKKESLAAHQKYGQVFEEKNGFLPNLSLLDALFCIGAPRTKEILINI